jgi:hypothetical protein
MADAMHRATLCESSTKACLQGKIMVSVVTSGPEAKFSACICSPHISGGGQTNAITYYSSLKLFESSSACYSGEGFTLQLTDTKYACWLPPRFLATAGDNDLFKCETFASVLNLIIFSTWCGSRNLIMFVFVSHIPSIPVNSGVQCFVSTVQGMGKLNLFLEIHKFFQFCVKKFISWIFF